MGGKGGSNGGASSYGGGKGGGISSMGGGGGMQSLYSQSSPFMPQSQPRQQLPLPMPQTQQSSSMASQSAFQNALMQQQRGPMQMPSQAGAMGGGCYADGGEVAPQAEQAQQIQAQGRGEDSQLVHMTPDEVNSLKGLAMRFGGDLTTNPQTGLPEAGWLGKLLPTLLGVGASFIPGVGPLIAAGAVAAGQTALTGDLGKGLTAGLQAFGGASMAGALGAGGAAAGAAPGATTGGLGAIPPTPPPAPGLVGVGTDGMEALQAAVPPPVVPPVAPPVAPPPTPMAAQVATPPPAPSPYMQQAMDTPSLVQPGAATPADMASKAASMQPTPQPRGGLGGLLDKFKEQSRELPGGGAMDPNKLPGKIAPWAAGAGVLSTLSDVTTPSNKAPKDEKSKYQEMTAAPRKSIFDDKYAGGLSPASSLGIQPLPSSPTSGGVGTNPPPVMNRQPFDSSERLYFDEVNPNPRVVPFNAVSATDPKKKKKSGLFADGGTVNMESGGHVIPAFDVATYGNGSTKAGQAKLAKMGGKAINGKGDGVSDSIKAKIDGKQRARLADGEVYFPPKAVAKLGGNKKLYAMMKAAETARRRTPSGSVVRGLA